MKELEKLLSDLVLHEIEKVLLEETSKELLASVSQSSTPSLEDSSYVGRRPSADCWIHLASQYTFRISST